MALSRGTFESEINDIEQLFKKLNFFEERNYYPNSDLDASVYRSKTFIENWKSLISENIYCFMLSDNSILNFKLDEKSEKIGFTFFECPFNCLTYREYLVENDIEGDFEEKVLVDYYEVYLHQCKQKENPLMIRYDLDYKSYFCGLHPASHIHIGHKNQIRLGFKKILKPKAFVSFILRQAYPSIWKTIITTDNKWKEYFIKEKSILMDIDEVYWQQYDKSEFYLA